MGGDPLRQGRTRELGSGFNAAEVPRSSADGPRRVFQQLTSRDTDMSELRHAPMIALSAIGRQGEIAAVAYLSASTVGDAERMGTVRDIGWAIDELRRRAGASKKELAIATGIDAGNLNRIISGRQWPTPERLAALSRYFSVPIWEFFRIAEQGLVLEQAQEDPRKERLKALIDQLDDDQLDVLFQREIHAAAEPTTGRVPPLLTHDTPRHKAHN